MTRHKAIVYIHGQVALAVQAGKLPPARTLPCSAASIDDPCHGTVGYHHDAYDMAAPFTMRPLCHKHHARWHAGNGAPCLLDGIWTPPELSPPESIRLDVQAPEALHARWREAAAAQGQTLAAWARAVLIAAAAEAADAHDPDLAVVAISVRRRWLREEADGGDGEIRTLVYPLAQAIYEWGGENNRGEDGKPTLVGNGHHMAQALCAAAVDIWKRHRRAP